MTESLKQKIYDYLSEKNRFIAGGIVEDFIRQTAGHKSSNASRRCRELVREGKLEAIYEKLPDVPNKVVYYRAVKFNLNGERIK